MLKRILTFIGLHKPKVIFMHGLPCSGKSTYANRLLAQNPNFVHLSFDDEAQKVAEEHFMTYNDLYRNQKGKALRKIASERLNKKLKEHIHNCDDIIFDLTNTSFRARRQSTLPFKGTRYWKEIHVLPHIDKQEFIDREMNRYEELIRFGIEKSINVSTYDKFAKDYSKPSKKEGFHKIVEVSL